MFFKFIRQTDSDSPSAVCGVRLKGSQMRLTAPNKRDKNWFVTFSARHVSRSWETTARVTWPGAGRPDIRGARRGPVRLV